MRFDALLDHIEQSGAKIEERDGKLRISAPKSVLTPVVVARLKQHKLALLEVLKNRSVAARRRCLVHADPASWLNEAAPNRPGWIRTTCKCCGGFVGYRPVEQSKLTNRVELAGDRKQARLDIAQESNAA
jgi:hypothetical protein